jgi:hypothetical protein
MKTLCFTSLVPIKHFINEALMNKPKRFVKYVRKAKPAPNNVVSLNEYKAKLVEGLVDQPLPQSSPKGIA